jgi:hypothetical protein
VSFAQGTYSGFPSMLPSGAKQADDAREVKKRTVVRTRRSAEGRRIVELIDRNILLLGSPFRAG